MPAEHVTYRDFITFLAKGFSEEFRDVPSVHSVYLTGSYASGDLIYGKSDVDLTIVLLDGCGAGERLKIEEKLQRILSIFDLRFDVSYERLKELLDALEERSALSSVTLWIVRKLGMRLYGSPSLESAPDPSIEGYLHDVRLAPLKFMRNIRNIASTPRSFDFPDPDGYGHGYVVLNDDGERTTKRLYSICAWTTNALYSFENRKYISCGREALKIWSPDHIFGFSGLSDAMIKLRDKWSYRVPDQEDEEIELLNICKRTLAWENAYLHFVRRSGQPIYR